MKYNISTKVAVISIISKEFLAAHVMLNFNSLQNKSGERRQVQVMINRGSRRAETVHTCIEVKLFRRDISGLLLKIFAELLIFGICLLAFLVFWGFFWKRKIKVLWWPLCLCCCWCYLCAKTSSLSQTSIDNHLRCSCFNLFHNFFSPTGSM